MAIATHTQMKKHRRWHDYFLGAATILDIGDTLTIPATRSGLAQDSEAFRSDMEQIAGYWRAAQRRLGDSQERSR